MPGVELGNKEELAPVQVLDGFANQAFSPPFPIHFSGVDYVDPGRQAIPYGRDFLLRLLAFSPMFQVPRPSWLSFSPLTVMYFMLLPPFISYFSILLYSFYFFFLLSIVQGRPFFGKKRSDFAKIYWSIP